MNIDTSERPRGRDDLVFRQLDEEWVIYDPATDRVHVLNLSAALVWVHCTGEFSLAEIFDAVEESYGASGGVATRSVVEDDVQAVLDRFREAGVLV